MLAVMMMPLVASCGGNDDSDDNIPSNSMVSYLTSREFSIKISPFFLTKMAQSICMVGVQDQLLVLYLVKSIKRMGHGLCLVIK